MKKTTWYVHLFVKRAGDGRSTAAIQVNDVHPRHNGLGLAEIRCYVVDGARKGEAAAVVIQWLATGRPPLMSVSEIAV